MNIHEYQAKEVLRGFGAPVPNGKPAFTVEEAVAQAKAAHPEDDGRFTRYVPKDRLERIYAIGQGHRSVIV